MIQKANIKHLDDILKLLAQVHKVHSDIRPDIFKAGEKKYNKYELQAIINDDSRPIFVALADDRVVGYAFLAIIEEDDHSHVKHKTLYIDDLCVDAKYRNKHIGQSLFAYIKEYAKNNNFYHITLNVYEGNDAARLFYEHQGMHVLKTTMELIV